MSGETKAALVKNPFTFVKECREELRKVTFPTKDETFKATMVTIILMTFIAVSLALMDAVLNQVMKQVL